MGGLIGSIIGYYFGESAGKKRNPTDDASPPQVVEQGPSQAESDITVPPRPPTDGQQGD